MLFADISLNNLISLDKFASEKTIFSHEYLFQSAFFKMERLTSSQINVFPKQWSFLLPAFKVNTNNAVNFDRRVDCVIVFVESFFFLQ